MRFRLVIASLLLSMLLQAVSLGGHWAGHGNTADALHAVLHWSGVLHHHDHAVTQAARLDSGARQPQDGAAGFEAFAEEFAQATLHPGESFHQDRSLDSRYHLNVDACLFAVGIIPSMPVSPKLAIEASPPRAVPASARTDPVLDGPRRPPRSLA
jgi:hypothetical protein